MLKRSAPALLSILVVWLVTSDLAWGGLPHWRRWRAPYPSDTYAPETRHYTVIDPVVVGTPRNSRHAVPVPGQVLWRQQVEAMPTYPWGWFGARRPVQNTGHERFYGEARDWSYLRGD
jgi:hypothetical protein